MKNTKVITVINNKGGVAKTITSVSLASIIGRRGKRVLLIDLDQQANATSALGVDHENLSLSISDLFFNGATIQQVAIQTEFTNLDLIPSNDQFTNALTNLIMSMKDMNTRLKKAISNFKKSIENENEDYDYIIIDCPPARNMLIVNALVVSTNIIIPTAPEKFSQEGIKRIVEFINDYEDEMPDYHNNYKVLITRWDSRLSIANHIISELQEHDFLKMYEYPNQETGELENVFIRKTVAVEESAYMGQPINYYAQKCTACIDYKKVADLIIEEN